MFRIFIYSIFIGAGGIAPGLSGGTLSIMLGVYGKLIKAFSEIFKNTLDSIKVLLPAGLGSLIGVVVFSIIQKELFASYKMEMMFLFIGLLVGSLPFLFKEANSREPLNRKNLPIRALLFTLALAAGLFMVFMEGNNIVIAPAEFTMTLSSIIPLMLLGILISFSLIVPGVSGTVLLLMIGQYGLILGLIAGLKDLLLRPGLDIVMASLPLLPIGVGVLLGVFIFSRLLSYLFKRWHGATYALILGFVTGSLPALYPKGSDFGFNSRTLFSIVLLLLGLAASYWFGKKELRIKD